MKLDDIKCEIQNTLENERKTYDEITHAPFGKKTEGWIEALEYVQGLLDRLDPKKPEHWTTTALQPKVESDPEPTTYNSSAIENLEYIEDVVFQLMNGNTDKIDRDDIYTSISWLAEELGYIYKNGGYMRKEDYLKIMKENK